MSNLPVGSIVSLPGDKLSLLCESNHFKQKAEQLEQELQQMWAENDLLRHALRTLSSQVQAAMPTLTALVEQRDALATVWAQADKVMRETK